MGSARIAVLARLVGGGVRSSASARFRLLASP
jgi:hypothetical protein